MKISKRQLRNIIREEARRVLLEKTKPVDTDLYTGPQQQLSTEWPIRGFQGPTVGLERLIVRDVREIRDPLAIVVDERYPFAVVWTSDAYYVVDYSDRTNVEMLAKDTDLDRLGMKYIDIRERFRGTGAWR